jgi:hypothetical protein
MEYLPEDLHRNVELKRKQKQDKLKNFRQYLVDKQIVLSLVKCNTIQQSYWRCARLTNALKTP